jgi:hypothetical protein
MSQVSFGPSHPLVERGNAGSTSPRRILAALLFPALPNRGARTNDHTIGGGGAGVGGGRIGYARGQKPGRRWSRMSMTNSNLWRYRETFDSTRDLVGYDVEATDGHIGKVDKATRETSRNYLVVDTGFWIFGRKRLIPAGVIDRVDHENRKVFVRMTKDEIKNAPDFDDQQEASYDNDYYDRVGGYYDPYGW